MLLNLKTRSHGHKKIARYLRKSFMDKRKRAHNEKEACSSHQTAIWDSRIPFRSALSPTFSLSSVTQEEHVDVSMFWEREKEVVICVELINKSHSKEYTNCDKFSVAKEKLEEVLKGPAEEYHKTVKSRCFRFQSKARRYYAEVHASSHTR